MTLHVVQDTTTPAGLVRRWRLDAVTLRGYGDERMATVVERMADELEAITGEAGAPPTSGTATPALLTVKDAAVRLGVSADWLYRNSHTMPFSCKIGKRVRFERAGLEEWVRHQTRARAA